MQKLADILGQQEITTLRLTTPEGRGTRDRWDRICGAGPWTHRDVVSSRGEVCRLSKSSFGHLELELYEAASGGERPRSSHLGLSSLADLEPLLRAAREDGIAYEIEHSSETQARCALLDTRDALGVCLAVPEADERPASTTMVPATADGDSMLRHRRVIQIGVIVDDVHAFAARYTELLGVPQWSFPEIRPSERWSGTFRDAPLEGAAFHIRVALGMCREMQIELLEPVTGSSSHGAFLAAQGPGLHHVSFGSLADHDVVVAAAQAQGVGIEMAGPVRAGLRFTYLDTIEELGMFLELLQRSEPTV